MKNTLLALKTRRTALAIIIADLQDERVDAPNERKKSIDREQKQYMSKLEGISDDISILSGVVNGLEEQWSKKNVSNKPVTVI